MRHSDDPRSYGHEDCLDYWDISFSFIAFCILLIAGCFALEFVRSIPARLLRWVKKVNKLFVPIVRE